MPYAQRRTYYDADSHIMELSDWIVDYADPGVREKIRPLYLGAAGKLADKAVAEAAARKGDPEKARVLEDNVMGPKGWGALGAFDPAERSRALDLLGFDKPALGSPRGARRPAGDELFLFSSDYPHPEGGHDPLGRFERSMDGISEAAKERFYSANFAHMMHWPQPLGGARDVVHSGVT